MWITKEIFANLKVIKFIFFLFSYRSFILLVFAFRSTIYSRLVFALFCFVVCSFRQGLKLVFFSINTYAVVHYHFLKILTFNHLIISVPLLKTKWLCMCESISWLYIVFLITYFNYSMSWSQVVQVLCLCSFSKLAWLFYVLCIFKYIFN